MKNQSEKKATLNVGLLGNLSGSLVGFIVTKKGVIYFKAKKTKKT